MAIRSVSVAGAIAFPAARLDQITAGLVGTSVPVEKIEAARTAFVSLYREQGYVLTTVGATVGRPAICASTS